MVDPFIQKAETKQLSSRQQKSHALNSWETKNTVCQIKFEHVSRLVRELLYHTYHGKEDHPSVDAFLCFCDKVAPTVKFDASNVREGGPKFFIQATPNYPVEKLTLFFLEIGLDMYEGKTSGENWEMVTSGYELLERLFGADKAQALAKPKDKKSAKVDVPVMEPGYDNVKDEDGQIKIKFIKEWSENPDWQEKFKHWGPNGIQDKEQSLSSPGSSSSSRKRSSFLLMLAKCRLGVKHTKKICFGFVNNSS